jgi:hypothetical protein
MATGKGPVDRRPLSFGRLSVEDALEERRAQGRYERSQQEQCRPDSAVHEEQQGSRSQNRSNHELDRSAREKVRNIADEIGVAAAAKQPVSSSISRYCHPD